MVIEPESARRLELWYRRGFGAITLKIEPVLPTDGAVWKDAIMARLQRPTIHDLRVTTLETGALAGATAYSWSSMEDAALLVVSDTLTVWVSGDGTPDAMLNMANSLGVPEE